VKLALVGFGHVGRAFARLLLRQSVVLRREYGLTYRVTAVITAHHGWVVDRRGVELDRLLDIGRLPNHEPAPAVSTLPAEVLIEVSTLDPRTGQPALDYIHQALNAGMHVVTANKGPIAHGYAQLSALALKNKRRVLFEATLADNLPVFNLKQHALPTAEILGLRGIVNSTTNYLLSEMANGKPFAPALAEAQRLGIAERDPQNDLDGWDAATKAVILAQVLMGSPLQVSEVVRQPIGETLDHRVRTAVAQGRRLRPVVTIDREGARWGPVELSPDDSLFAVDGFSLALDIDTDVAGRLTVVLHDPHVEQTAFALLSDLVSLGVSAPPR
jgi:homoserine dehydrogenase